MIVRANFSSWVSIFSMQDNSESKQTCCEFKRSDTIRGILFDYARRSTFFSRTNINYQIQLYFK